MSLAARRRPPAASKQRGVVLYVALIVLIVMALVGVAMMRGSGTGISISGNLAMKQNATNVADIGTEAARTWLMAQTAGTLSTPDLVAEAGLKYIVEWHYDDQPLSMQVRSGCLVAMPYSIDVNDGWNLKENVEAEELIQAITDQFDRLYREGETSTRVMCLALHPWVLGQPHRLKYLDRILAYMLGHDRIWLATAAEICDWYLQHHAPVLDGSIPQQSAHPREVL